MVSQVRSLEIESWTLYPFGLLLVAARIVSRCILLGSWRKLQIDDWIMVFVCVTFTGVIVSVNQVSHNLSNYLPAGAAEKFTPEEKDNAIFGSKFVMILEEFMLANTWLCKACLLILYHQMTQGLKQNKLVKIVGAYCVFGYVLVQILYLAVWCRPIQQYWQVPVDNSQCASYYNHLITASVFNITSDLMMLYIPLPILIRARLPLKRKIILCGVFSLGLLVILSAILNRYYNFTEPYGSLIYLNWYVGEASTSVFVSNVPHLWPLLSRLFSLSAFISARRTGQSGSNGTPRPTLGGDQRSGSRFGSKAGGMGNMMKTKRSHPSSGYLRTESEERIIASGGGKGGGTAWPLSSTSTSSPQHTSTLGAGDAAGLEMGRLDIEDRKFGYTEERERPMGYMASAAGPGDNGGGRGNGDVEKGDVDVREGIVRTVEVRQYSS